MYVWVCCKREALQLKVFFLRVGAFRCRVVPTYLLAHGISGGKNSQN